MASREQSVKRRRVFYIPGYDPFPPRRYRELYRKEGAEQARISGYELAVAPRRDDGAYGWHVTMEDNGERSEAEFEVLVWSDIVARSMGRSIAATYGQLVRTAWIYIASGALFRLARLRKGPTIAALYPVAFLVAEALVAGLAGWGAAAVLCGVIDLVIAGADGGPALLRPLLAAGGGMAVAVAVMRWFRRIDGRIFAWYLMHDYAFSAGAGGATPDALRGRLGQFTARVAESLEADWDEVLVVGHSSGAHLAVTVLADLIRAGRVPAGGSALGFLSLGHVVPMVSFLPKAQELRGDLAYLSARDELTWVDVSAPGDGCAYALCDPVGVSGVAPADKRWPLVISAAFTQTLSPDRWRALRWRFFRLHFQYLCAFDRPGDYDYFRITAGARTLADRFRGRAPSQSRIEQSLNRFRDVA